MPDSAPKEALLENLRSFAVFPTSLQAVDQKQFMKHLLVYMTSKFQLLPELADVLSIKDTMRLLYAFAGQVLEFPTQDSVTKGIRDLDIFFTLERNPTPAELKHLSEHYDLTIPTIRYIVEKVSKILGKPDPLPKNNKGSQD